MGNRVKTLFLEKKDCILIEKSSDISESDLVLRFNAGAVSVRRRLCPLRGQGGNVGYKEQ